jgi:Rod binding domain-containing protein
MSIGHTTQIGASTPKPSTETEKKAWKTSQDFEAILLRQIFQSMRKATEIMSENDGDEKIAADTQMQDMAWDGLADQIAHEGGFGLAKMIYPKMLEDGQNGPILPRPSAPSAPRAAKTAYSGSRATPATLEDAIQKASKDSGLDSTLIRAVIHTESGGNFAAVSPKGAIGPMQLMPATAAELGVDPHDPVQNILGGSRYLAALRKQFGDDRLALAAYNAGPSAVQRHGGIPPYPETQAYVRKVIGTRDTLKGTR